MTLSELKNNYTPNQLSSFPGDPVLRRKLFSPFFENLYDNKIVYYEHFRCIARIEEMMIEPEIFSAIARVHLPIEKKPGLGIQPDILEKGWSFGGKWEAVTFSNMSFGLYYTSVVFITDPDTVQQIESMALKGDHYAANRLIFDAI